MALQDAKKGRTMGDPGEIVDLIEAAIDRAFDKHFGPQDYRPPEVLIAEAIVADLGIVPTLEGWCPIHGSASCPEQYMLMSSGAVAPGYQDHWSEALRCGRRQPTYRLGGHFGSIGEVS